MLDQAAEDVMAIAVRIGMNLPAESRPYNLAGLMPVNQLDPAYMGRLADRVEVRSRPPEVAHIDQWFSAICRDDDVMAKSIEEAIDAAGLRIDVMKALAAFNQFSGDMAALLKSSINLPLPASALC